MYILHTAVALARARPFCFAYLHTSLLSCPVLCCVVLCCVVWSCVVLCCVVFVLCCVVFGCVVLSCVVFCCVVLRCVVLSCGVLRCPVTAGSAMNMKEQKKEPSYPKPVAATRRRHGTQGLARLWIRRLCTTFCGSVAMMTPMIQRTLGRMMLAVPRKL